MTNAIAARKRIRPRTLPDGPNNFDQWLSTYLEGHTLVATRPVIATHHNTPLKTNRLWVVTTLFNPAGYKSLTQNYNRFARHIREAGVNLLTAELTYPGQTPNIEGALHLEAQSVMWHKERLLNLAIRQLPDECDMVAWIDADVLFTNYNWVEQTIDRLTRHPVVQMFEQCIMLDPDGDYYKEAFGFAFSLASGFLDNPGDRYTYHNGNFKHPGFAWAARRDTINAWGGLYDRHILGGGDFQMGLALVGDQDSNWYTRFGTTFQQDMLEWSHNAIKVTGGSLGYVPGMIMHMWHGHSEDRQYVERSKCLVDYQFDPKTDIIADDNGLWRWNTDKQAMHAKVAEYFATRREDLNLPVHPTRYQDKYPIIMDPDGGNDVILDMLHKLSVLGRSDFCVHIACYDWRQSARIKPLTREREWPFQIKLKASYASSNKDIPRRFQLARSLGPDCLSKKFIFVDRHTNIKPDFLHRIVRCGKNVVTDSNGRLLLVDRESLLCDEVLAQSTQGEDRVLTVAMKKGKSITTIDLA